MPRSIRLRSSSVALCVAALVACSASLGDATDGAGATTGTSAPAETSGAPTGTGPETTGTSGAEATGTDGPATTDAPTTAADDGPRPCSDAAPCPGGQDCINGLCALACAGDDDCPGDQYCADDDRCHDRIVPTCPETPCADGQICFEGYCSTPPGGSCRPDPGGQDGCAANALCYEDPEREDAAACYTLPYCGEGDVCPTGTTGAVCNVDLVPNKHKICMLGACTEVAHCPADWKCVKIQGAVVGFCSSGAAGYPCAVDTDCVSGNCEGFPGFPGLCL